MFLRLIPASYLPCWTFLFGKWYNIDDGVLIYPYNTDLLLTADDISFFTINDNFKGQFVGIIRRLQQLDLTEEESIITEALCFVLVGKHYALSSSVGLGNINIIPNISFDSEAYASESKEILSK